MSFFLSFKLDVGSKGKFVVLDVDNLPGLVVGMHSQQTKEVVSGQIRLALGGLLASKDKMIVEVLYFYHSKHFFNCLRLVDTL